jgi:hypothetical protein
LGDNSIIIGFRLLLILLVAGKNVTRYVIFEIWSAAKSLKGDRSFNYWLLLTNPTVDKGARAISFYQGMLTGPPSVNGRCWPTSVGNRNWTNN